MSASPEVAAGRGPGPCSQVTGLVACSRDSGSDEASPSSAHRPRPFRPDALEPGNSDPRPMPSRPMPGRPSVKGLVAATRSLRFRATSTTPSMCNQSTASRPPRSAGTLNFIPLGRRAHGAANNQPNPADRLPRNGRDRSDRLTSSYGVVVGTTKPGTGRRRRCGRLGGHGAGNRGGRLRRDGAGRGAPGCAGTVKAGWVAAGVACPSTRCPGREAPAKNAATNSTIPPMISPIVLPARRLRRRGRVRGPPAEAGSSWSRTRCAGRRGRAPDRRDRRGGRHRRDAGDGRRRSRRVRSSGGRQGSPPGCSGCGRDGRAPRGRPHPDVAPHRRRQHRRRSSGRCRGSGCSGNSCGSCGGPAGAAVQLERRAAAAGGCGRRSRRGGVAHRTVHRPRCAVPALSCVGSSGAGYQPAWMSLMFRPSRWWAYRTSPERACPPAGSHWCDEFPAERDLAFPGTARGVQLLRLPVGASGRRRRGLRAGASRSAARRGQVASATASGRSHRGGARRAEGRRPEERASSSRPSRHCSARPRAGLARRPTGFRSRASGAVRLD